MDGSLIFGTTKIQVLGEICQQTVHQTQFQLQSESDLHGLEFELQNFLIYTIKASTAIENELVQTLRRQ